MVKKYSIAALKLIVLSSFCLAVVGCAAIPWDESRSRDAATSAESESAEVPDIGGEMQGATSSLRKSSRDALAAGNYPLAMDTLERALRIEPQNPWLWIELGAVHVATGNHQQAAAFARKALSLAGGDAAAARSAHDLLRQAGNR